MSKAKSGTPALCPSAPGVPGAVLIGVVEADGRVANLGTPLPVDSGFLRTAAANGPPERLRADRPRYRPRDRRRRAGDIGDSPSLCDSLVASKRRRGLRRLPAGRHR